ncbi:MAG: hypothetical protein ACRD18_07525 [Terriglobia bacterium]
MGNSPNNAGWKWITGPIVDASGAPTAAFQKWLALVLSRIVSPNGTIASGAQINGQAGTVGGNISALQAQAANLSAGGLLSATGVGFVFGQVPDGAGYSKVQSVNGSNQATTGSLADGSVNSSLTQTVNSYVNITTAGQIITANFTPDGGEVKLTVQGAIASTNATAIGWSIDFYKNGVEMAPAFDYMGFDTPGNSRYVPFSFSVVDTSPGTSENTYSVQTATNLGGTLSFIPVALIIENKKV